MAHLLLYLTGTIPYLREVVVNAQIIELPLAPAQPVTIGQLIGRYRVESIIGEGGMGVVFSARHLDLDMRVAIKVIRAELARDERIVERMMNEARAVASLKSDHVVRVYDVARLPNGTPYMVLELVDGPDLDRVLEASGPMSVDDAVAHMLDVCVGLSDAHSRGIIHRDIKPENLLVESLTDGTTRVKISDFGIAKKAITSRREMSVTQESGSVGSPWYMAPEQMINAPDVDARADVWSLGVVLFELLSGTMPFPGDTPGEVCARVMSMAPVSIDAVRPDLPAGIKHVLERCLEKSRERRYPDVAELALDLAAISPKGMTKARSVARRLGAEDVFVGRTLTNIPVVTIEQPLPDVPRLRIPEEASVIVTLDEVPGVRPLWPRVLLAAALLAIVTLASIPTTRDYIATSAHGTYRRALNAITEPDAAPRTLAPTPQPTLLPTVALATTPVAPSVVPPEAAVPVIVGPVVEVPLPAEPRARWRAARSSDAYVPPPAAEIAPVHSRPNSETPTPSESAPPPAPPAEIVGPTEVTLDPPR